MKVDLNKFQGSLPYASEIFGIYQPLLGWKSHRAKRRFKGAADSFRNEVVAYAMAKVFPDVKVETRDDRVVNWKRFNPGTLALPERSGLNPQINGMVARAVLSRLQKLNADPLDDKVWSKVLSEQALAEIMQEVQKTLQGSAPEAPVPMTVPFLGSVGAPKNQQISLLFLQGLARRESVIAGTLLLLAKNKLYPVLRELFFPVKSELDFASFFDMKKIIDPLESFDPKTDLERVVLSPVGIVHLFRQYFFEFDTFLGSPVQHIWLSPGATIELIEVNSRKTLLERSSESALETLVKTEKSLTEADEISDAIRTDNQSNTKFGVSVNVEAGVNFEFVSATAGASASYGFDTNERRAREHLHKQTRQQSSKLSTEIKKNFKSTFKTTTEAQDTTSKRYILENKTPELVNYELRRKMRQVGVQLQDVGTRLCWQTYVDLPGNDLGVAKLVHIAEPADLSSNPQPEAPVRLEAKTVDVVVAFPYENTSGSDEKDVTFYQGSDEEGGTDHNDRIVWVRNYQADPPDLGYTLDESISLLPQHSSTCAAEAKRLDAKGKYEIRLNQVNFDDQSQINIKVTLRWNPPDQAAAEAKFKADQENYKRETERVTKEAFVKAARERIRVASNVEPRNAQELREEERIVVYRKLIGQLLNVGVNLANSRTRHLTAELISSLFDIDKMLYFVAPEWWRPRTHVGHQTFGTSTPGGVATTTTQITSDNVVSWGGANEWRPDNYYITEDSRPAKLGSSLGWLLQLDGDNLRNAFLNAPWVKAVIPIRPGKELAALNWLSHAAVEGTDGLDAKYQPASQDEANTIAKALSNHAWDDPADQQRYGHGFGPAAITIRDALRYLALTVLEKYQKSNGTKTEPGDEGESYLPTDVVFERGFYPLSGGFKAQASEPFEVFDQWVEILPTDQLVAVEVKYDPKTGMQI